MDIEDWRNKIDEVDLEMLRLLNERAKFSIEIGRLKKLRQLPVYSPEREQWILRRLLSENLGPLTEDGVRRIFERIIDESRRLEHEILSTHSITKPNEE